MRRYGDAVVRLDGNRDPDEVYEDIADVLAKLR